MINWSIVTSIVIGMALGNLFKAVGHFIFTWMNTL